MSSVSFQQQFNQLTQLLTQFQWLWQPMPMAHRTLPWHEQKALCDWLTSLDHSQMMQLKAEPEAVITQLSHWWPALARLVELTAVRKASTTKVDLDARLAVGVPGRKWAQIKAYIGAIPNNEETVRYLEWCAGKGYLGRAISSVTGKPVESLEWQKALCEQGQAFADQHALAMTFYPLDAMSEQAASVVGQCDHGLALHACGDLHVQLLQTAVQSGMPRITVSPCCYQLIRDSVYQPLSDSARRQGMALTKTDLKLAVQESVTGGQRVRRQREQEVVYRLGFDEWQRDWQHRDQYLPLPALKKSQLNQGFNAFCRWGAAQKGLMLPADFDAGGYLGRGEARFTTLEQINVVKSAFRRAMEIWLVLDRVLFLEQHGYAVSLVQFCERELTPRNLLIHAEKIS
ncbi:methyltransferase [Salinivibrio kushneri]|uniref:Methyltransferase n=1 Tax=Salinivibrio kushneri TaxID=1908198 RepID=A0AA47KMW4_9GAMM|nr:methyltransferase [Salinivibrio kushneri]WBA09537.1 methyltransferase [Salinivibrio kushneri]